jgi:hypothetical protein
MYTVSSWGDSRGLSSTLITRSVVEDNVTANGDEKLTPYDGGRTATSSGNNVDCGTSRGNTDEVAASNGGNHDVSAANGSNDDVAAANRDDNHLIGGRDQVATANVRHIATVTRSHIATHGVTTVAAVYVNVIGHRDVVVVALDGDSSSARVFVFALAVTMRRRLRPRLAFQSPADGMDKSRDRRPR